MMMMMLMMMMMMMIMMMLMMMILQTGAKDFLVKKVVSHPQYSRSPIPINDIALLVLDTPSEFIMISPWTVVWSVE